MQPETVTNHAQTASHKATSGTVRMRKFRLYRRGKSGIYWVDFGLVGGVSQRRTTGTADKSAAREIAAAFARDLLTHRHLIRIRSINSPEIQSEWPETMGRPETTARLFRMWKNAQQRAKKNKIIWALSLDDFWLIVRQSNGRCAVTGLPFAIDATKHNPEQPSLDRVNSSLGYSRGNCRMVLLAVNYAMNTWGENTFRKIAISFATTILQDAITAPQPAP
jgi:hypothetical protein